MSKYTKALEKIQTERESKQVAVDKRENRKDPGVTGKVSPDPVRMDSGITTVKNTRPDDRMVMLRFPDCVASEQYRMLRTSLKAQASQQGAKVIMVSSSIHSEGKTVTASNIALSLAESGDDKVILIDADLRRGKVAEYLGFDKKRQGLSELILNDLNPKRVMVQNSVPNLVVIPRGGIYKKPSELVGSKKLQILVNELRLHYDYIILDAPPIMSVADAGILARIVDGVVFVIQVGRTPKTIIAHSQQLFQQAGANMLGYVLTNVEYHSSDYRYYGYESYYSYTEIPENLREKSKYEMKKAGWNLKTLEERFNKWWEKRVLKKKRKKKRVKISSKPELTGKGTQS